MTDTATDNPAAATPTGEPDNRDRDAWLLLAAITSADIENADQFWRQHVPRSRQGMLSHAGWRWDAARQLYVSRTGQEVGGAALRRQADQLVDEMEHEMRAEAQRVAVGEIDLDEWQQGQAQDVIDLYVAVAALAAGGTGSLTTELLRRVEGVPDRPPGIAFSLDKLYDFAAAIAAGADRANTESAIAGRAGMYSEAAIPLFEDITRKSHQAARDEKGRRLFLYERNILGPNEDHCADCPEETAKGWSSIGSLIPIGQRECLFRCKCRMDYALSPQ